MSKAETFSEVSIVGGGFAGLSAALRLQRAGAKIRIFEKRPFFGGRAYSFIESKSGESVDNGQHLMMGAYHETLQFLKDLGTDSLLHQQENLAITFAKSHCDFPLLSCPNLPAPLHLAWGLYKFKGLSWKDKIAMIRLINFCKAASKSGGVLDEKLHQTSVSDLFRQTKQSPRAIEVFWEPVGLATLNEPMHQASAALFIEVIQRALLSKKQDSQLIFPQVGFDELYCKPMERLLQEAELPVHFQTQISEIKKDRKNWCLVTQSGKTFFSEKLILALPPPALKKVLKHSELSLQKELASLTKIDQIQSAPIVSINLWYRDFQPQQSFVGLIGSPIHWLFNKAKVYSQKPASYVSLVVSGAHSLAMMQKKQLVDLAHQEMLRFYPEVESKQLWHSQVIKEHEATFAAQIGEQALRPACRSGLEGIYLAGDWTDTALPATIESAVLSGHRAAEMSMKS